MIPNDYKPQKKAITNYEPIPTGAYKAKIKDIELLKDVPSYNDPKVLEDQYSFSFEIVDGQYAGKILKRKTSIVLNSGYKGNSSWLYKIFCTAYNVFIADSEIPSIGTSAINSLVGKELMVLVKQKPSKKDPNIIFNNITDVYAVEAKPMANFEQIKGNFEVEDNSEKEYPKNETNEEVTIEDIPF